MALWESSLCRHHEPGSPTRSPHIWWDGCRIWCSGPDSRCSSLSIPWTASFISLVRHVPFSRRSWRGWSSLWSQRCPWSWHRHSHQGSLAWISHRSPLRSPLAVLRAVSCTHSRFLQRSWTLYCWRWSRTGPALSSISRGVHGAPR